MREPTREDREKAIVGAINRAREDVKAGRVVPHAQAMRRIYATIDRIARTARRSDGADQQ